MSSGGSTEPPVPHNGVSITPRRTPRVLTARKIPPLLVGRASSNTPPGCQPMSERGVVRKLSFRQDLEGTLEGTPEDKRQPKCQRRSASPASVLTASLSYDTDGSQNSEVSSASVFRYVRTPKSSSGTYGARCCQQARDTVFDHMCTPGVLQALRLVLCASRAGGPGDTQPAAAVRRCEWQQRHLGQSDVPV